jgi:class 3 adenylate cyclase
LALASANLVESLRKERQVLQSSLLLNQKISQYLPRSVVESISVRPEAALQLGGARRRAAVLFSDLVGFTPWSERVEPENAVAFLNWYFTAMDRIVTESKGILDKRIGDGMMVVFLEDDGLHSPARRALRCGLNMQAMVSELNADPTRPRLEPFQVRIGVSYGEPVAGNLGSAERMEYTVIGDTVNVASRLEGRCEPGAVLATEQALAAAGPGVRAEPRGELIVKGRTQVVVAWEVQGLDDTQETVPACS